MNKNILFLLLSILFIVSSNASWMGIDDKWKQIILETPSTALLEEYLYNLTSEPHLSGTIFDYNTAQYVHDKFVEFGLDAEIIKFESIISYPLSRSVSLFSENGTSVYNCTLEEAVVPEDPTSNNTNISLTYNVYSPSGSVRAPLVYVNYGREQDYISLENLGIDVKGKIVIARYGQIFRGLKVYGAQVRGAVGILIYSDPIDDGFFQGDVYPKGPFRPETGVQEGSPLLLNICPGDPSEERLKEKCFSDETITALGVNTTLPQILVQPISYGDAKYLLESLDGVAVPIAWQGGLAFHYHYGGTNKTLVEMEIEMNITKVELWNVKGYVNGSSSNQQKVMFGNHRDAWIFGAVDPSSGTSVMLELARTFGELKKQGWIPERTIVFSSWDGEEQGLIGSTYDAEENLEDYNKTLIAYLNVDTAVTFLNPVLRIGASPILYSVIRESMKLVTDPNTGKSLYDVFSGSFGVLGSGSDYTAFLDTLGVSSADFSFSRASGDYGVYHSRYDSFYWMKNFGDPEFLYHKAMTQLLGMIGVMISTNPILPLNQSDTASFLQSNFDSIKPQISGSFPDNADLKNINFNSMQKAIDKFSKNSLLVNNFILKNENKSLSDDENLREQVNKLNEALFMTERRFLEQSGIPQRPFYKHLLQAPGLYKGYGSDVFPGITDSLSDGDFDRTADQFTLLVSKINDAADYSKGPLKNTLSTETILLIVFGVAIIVILVIFISVLVYKRRNKSYEKF